MRGSPDFASIVIYHRTREAGLPHPRVWLPAPLLLLRDPLAVRLYVFRSVGHPWNRSAPGLSRQSTCLTTRI